MANGFGELIAEIISFWAIADVITSVLYYLILVLTGNMADIISGVVITQFIDSLNPLLALAVGWVIDPIWVIVQVILFMAMLFIVESGFSGR